MAAASMASTGTTPRRTALGTRPLRALTSSASRGNFVRASLRAGSWWARAFHSPPQRQQRTVAACMFSSCPPVSAQRQRCSVGVSRWRLRAQRDPMPTPGMPDDPATQTERSPLDFPEEITKPLPSNRPDIFPELKPIKPVPDPPNLPGDPEIPDEEAEEDEENNPEQPPGEEEEEEEEEEDQEDEQPPGE
ncbi:hypothetical protein RI054_38g141610 [Pseudoscourfieldia marina]